MSIPRGLGTAGSMVVAGGLAAMVGLTPAGAALSELSPPVSGESPPAAVTLHIGPAGLVADRGLTVYVPVTVTCSTPGTPNGVSVTLRERVGDQIASANGNAPVACTGGPVRVTVRTDAYQIPVRRGVAVVDAFVYVCNPLGCDQVQDRRSVLLV